MYIPSAFQETRIPVMHQLIQAHPLGLLISQGTQGLAATPIPFLVQPEAGPQGTLVGHLAKANPQWRDLEAGADCLVVFQGEQGYVTPSWYPGKALTGKVVPTWNYIVVQAWGRARLHSDADWLRRLVGRLTAGQEEARPQPWAVGDAPADFIQTQLAAIVGIEIPIERLEGKWKLSQNREPADRAGVVAGLRRQGDPHGDPVLAERVDARIPDDQRPR